MLSPNLSQSDYLQRKKRTQHVCNTPCTNLSRNKTNLIIGLYAPLQLTNIPVLSTPVTISNTEPFYYSNTIDPSGNLFGKHPCGILNYTQYMSIPKNV
jgi:hypothetical protein